MSDQPKFEAHQQAREFWVWHDLLLDDHFTVECSDAGAVNLLHRLKEEGVVLVLVRAGSSKEALASAFPDRGPSHSSSIKRR